MLRPYQLPVGDLHWRDLGDMIVVVKSADETVNNSTTLQNDDELLFAVGANEVWQFELWLLANSSTVADLKWAWTVPTGATLEGIYLGATNAGADGIQLFNATDAISVYGGGADLIPGRITGIVVVGGTPGNVQFQWAQDSLEVSDTKVLQNTVLIARRVK